MFCVAIRDALGEIVDIYGPYDNTNQCMTKVDSLLDIIPSGWKFKIFNLYK